MSEQDFLTEAFNSDAGCSTFIIDIAWSDVKVALGLADTLAAIPQGLVGSVHMLDDWPSDWWIVVRYTKPKEKSSNYAYELFANVRRPTYLNIKSLCVAKGPSVAAPVTSGKALSMSAKQKFNVLAFHVGQGMCSLVKGSSDGILLDAGAGTPVTRAAYQANSFVNELQQETAGLKLQAVISHPDSDHWRVLDWDSALCAQVNAIFTPSGTPSLGLKSKHVVSRVHPIGNAMVNNGTRGSVLFSVHRSAPSLSDRNGQCLVVETNRNGHSVLFPGDYVYSRFGTDGNAAIKGLAAKSFDAVVVPHHGDSASRLNVVTATVANSTTTG